MKVKLLQKPFGVYFILKMFCEYRRRSVFQINQGQRIPIKWESWTHEGGEIIQIKKKNTWKEIWCEIRVLETLCPYLDPEQSPDYLGGRKHWPWSWGSGSFLWGVRDRATHLTKTGCCVFIRAWRKSSLIITFIYLKNIYWAHIHFRKWIGY